MFPSGSLVTRDSAALPSIKTMGKVFLFDFQSRKYVLRDGKPVEATYEEAIKQWITLLLITELDQYPVYQKTEFGIRFKHFIGRRDIPAAVINSELKRQIEEKTKLHPEIKGVTGFAFSRDGGKGKISFQIQTLRGINVDIESEVTINGRYY